MTLRGRMPFEETAHIVYLQSDFQLKLSAACIRHAKFPLLVR